MRKPTRPSRIDDAFFVLALAIPTMFAVARYVDSAARASAIILAHEGQQSAAAQASSREKTLLARASQHR